MLRLDGKIVERPQHMLMRVAIGIHKNDIDQAIDRALQVLPEMLKGDMQAAILRRLDIMLRAKA